MIVVITPHIIDNNDDNFRIIIPQDESIFDSFGNTLFPNSYRLKESDIYDLNFITESDYLNTIKNNAKDALSSGDPILSENYLQHADHFSRKLSDLNYHILLNSVE